MNLEVIPFGRSDGVRPPLLLIHGAYCGAWVWEEYFIPHLESLGWHGAALSLRGHGKSDGYTALDLWGLSDYTDDAELVLDQLGGEAIVIGHSMGGAVAQMLATRRPLAGMALMVSVPPTGMAASAHHMWVVHPALTVQLGAVLSWGALGIDPELMSHGLFSSGTPTAQQSRYLLKFQRESRRAAWEVMLPQQIFRPRKAPPTLVLGGDADAFVPESELRATAEFWDAECHIVPGLPHGMCMDAMWRRAADPIATWLEHHTLSLAAE
jgi:pimeloyl-ACP methyl ester carboxylesterase